MNIIEGLLTGVVLIGMIGAFILWVFGVPYLTFMIIDSHNYSFYLSIWLFVLLFGMLIKKWDLEEKNKELLKELDR